MTELQFRVLYREFLLRTVDVELLSAQGDPSKLLGQFAMVLTFFSLWVAVVSVGSVKTLMPRPALLIGAWNMEHFLIATTMLVVGLFAVLSWDSTFPDRRDVLVLAPLPIRARTIFLAKVAALATALGLSVSVLNIFTGIAYPLALAPPTKYGFLDMAFTPEVYRSLAAYWITMFAAGAFIFCSVLGVQGLAAQLLKRRHFLRVSAFLQMAAFCLVLTVYLLQPSLTTPQALAAPENQRALAWLPSYWFLGMYQELNGSLHAALVPLARRAWVGLGVACFGAGTAFLLSYFRTLRMIVEEPDIVSGSRRGSWSPRLGNAFETAIVLFSVRTLFRSRQHRMILAFYLGTAFAIVLAYVHTPLAQRQLSHRVNVPFLVASVVMMCFAVVGARVVFAMPLALKANWVFRMTELSEVPEYLAAARRALLLLAVAPVWVVSGVVYFSIWPAWPVAGHLAALGLFGLILANVCLFEFHKVPFTCSYLPGKANVYVAFLTYVLVVIPLTDRAIQLERRALMGPASCAAMLAILGVAAACAWWRTAVMAKSEEVVMQFEDAPPAGVFVLGLYRDGVLVMEPSQARYEARS
ncbi:MAG: beta-lactamase [Bryobacterales bacterium]|nr:beta-lactamase [Bryobacterales bacterium]